MDSNRDALRLSDLFSNERINERQAKDELRIPLLHFTKNMNLYSKVVCEVLRNTERFPQNFAPLIIMFRLIGTLQSVKTLMVKGYYFESHVLIRNFYESLGICVFLKKNPEKVPDWIDGKNNLVTSIEAFHLAMEIFRKEENKELKENIRRTYGKLCNFVHSNSAENFCSIVDLKKSKGQGYFLQIPASLNQEEIHNLWLFSFALILAVMYVFEDSLSEKQWATLRKRLNNELDTLRDYTAIEW